MTRAYVHQPQYISLVRPVVVVLKDSFVVRVHVWSRRDWEKYTCVNGEEDLLDSPQVQGSSSGSEANYAVLDLPLMHPPHCESDAGGRPPDLRLVWAARNG